MRTHHCSTRSIGSHHSAACTIAENGKLVLSRRADFGDDMCQTTGGLIAFAPVERRFEPEMLDIFRTRSNQHLASTRWMSTSIDPVQANNQEEPYPRRTQNLCISHTCTYRLFNKLRNSSLVLALDRIQPNIQLVVVIAPVFWTPLITIHK